MDRGWAQMLMALFDEHGLDGERYDDLIERIRPDPSYQLAYRIWLTGGTNDDIWRQIDRALGPGR